MCTSSLSIVGLSAFLHTILIPHRSNIQHDRELHKLLHTQLLSGSLNQELNMTPAQRRKALEGRVLELAGAAKLGKGDISVRKDEKNKAAKRLRDGMAAKAEIRSQQELEKVGVALYTVYPLRLSHRHYDRPRISEIIIQC